MYEMIHLNVT